MGWIGLLCMAGGVYLLEAEAGGWLLFGGYVLWTAKDAQGRRG